MIIQSIAVAELSLDPSNVRKHSRRNLDAIKASLRKFGQQKPIVVDAKGIVLAGNGTLTAAKELGWTEIQATRTELAGVEATAFAIADNRTAELAEWDEDGLAKVLESLKVEDADLLAATGYDSAEVDKMVGAEVVEDEVPEPPAEPITKPGDLWILGEHRVMCGDSTKAEDVERLMEGKKADMVFTDPPYGVSYTDSLGRSIKNDDLTDGDLQKFLRDAFATGVAVTAADAPWYVWHASRYQREFENALNDCSINVKQQIIWVKGEGVDGTAQVRAPAIGRSDFRWLHEPCFYASRGNPFNAGDRKTTTVWTVSRPTTGTVHPTQKPIPLIEIALENSAKNNAMVLDLFGGSGSTLIACEKTSRQARLMELDPRYCDVIVKRWENLTGKKAVLENRIQ